MFEDSLFSSSGQRVTLRSRWTAVASIFVQVLLVGLLISVPLLRPETLPVLSLPPALLLVSKPVPPPVVKPQVLRQTSTSAASPKLPSAIPVQEPRGFLPSPARGIPAAATDADIPLLISTGLGMGTGLPGELSALRTGSSSGGHAVVLAARPVGKPRISAGVSAGMLLQPMHPIYPAIARAAHVDGTVVITATIDKSGRIVGLQVVSGPPMLRSSAVDAVKDARYRPFFLNGEPTEVETTISVNFRMSGG